MSWFLRSCVVIACGACSAADPSAPPAGAPTRNESEPTADVSVPFDVGFTFGPRGDEIHVDEVRGDHASFVAGGTYRVRGHYVLRSQPDALLLASVMNGRTDETHGADHVVVGVGSGTFDLVLKIRDAGYPHLGLYPTHGGRGFAGTLFGRGDTLFTRGWPDAGE